MNTKKVLRFISVFSLLSLVMYYLLGGFIAVQNSEPEEYIFGKWVNIEDPSSFWEFKDDNVMISRYAQYTYHYRWEITEECRRFTLDKEENMLLLKLFMDDSEEYDCYKANVLENELTLTQLESGRIHSFRRAEE